MKQAFSLVELSIVLAILGLLTGGIIAGQSLIRAAELRKLTVSVQKYQKAIYAFRTKYRSFPGDMDNATFFWGAADAGDGEGSDCFGVDQTGGTATCNGSGNGFIGTPTGGTGSWQWGERFTSWKHLANAGLIEGNYSGKSDHPTASNNVTAGVNTPPSIDGEAFILFVSGSVSTTFYNNGGDRNAFATRGFPLTPEEAWNLDTKLDDGKPGTGRIASTHFTTDPNCADNATHELAEYVLTFTGAACNIVVFGL